MAQDAGQPAAQTRASHARKDRKQGARDGHAEADDEKPLEAEASAESYVRFTQRAQEMGVVRPIAVR